ncbi:hypothetical protein EGI31_13590 [Lacihabitans soyangensis]|uniref:Uncharacterized protein n=1 Tax=Lacihabitans soyangensis TaxID=869394 RepID=A0AAE3H2P7_9BACT|nr:hypothetical protein [Lacihabitans soyangensis]
MRNLEVIELYFTKALNTFHYYLNVKTTGVRLNKKKTQNNCLKIKPLRGFLLRGVIFVRIIAPLRGINCLRTENSNFIFTRMIIIKN